MESYIEMKKRHQKEVNAFPMAFAFTQEGLQEALAKLGLGPAETDKVCTIYGFGDIVRKSDVPAFEAMTRRHKDELNSAIAEDASGEGFIYEMFQHELLNHEYPLTDDLEETLAALCLSEEDFEKNPMLEVGLNKAIKNISGE